mgnify:CR=1 FL=1
MNYLQIILTAFIALIHIYIVYLEMALWTTKKGIKAHVKRIRKLGVINIRF